MSRDTDIGALQPGSVVLTRDWSDIGTTLRCCEIT